MRAYSGILVLNEDHRRNGSATIDFDQFHPHGADVGDAAIHQPIVVGGDGKFNATPAYIVSLREWTADDKATGRGEGDTYVINSTINRDRLTVDWQLKDDHGGLSEISFLVVGN